MLSEKEQKKKKKQKRKKEINKRKPRTEADDDHVCLAIESIEYCSLDRCFDDQRKIGSVILERLRTSVDGHWFHGEMNLSAGYGGLRAERDPGDQV